MNNLNKILFQWVKLGAMFGCDPSCKTPDVEKLIIDSAGAMPQSARLHAMVVSWLGKYFKAVCRHRLAVLASQISCSKQSAILGYTLDRAKSLLSTDHFNLAIQKCSINSNPEPMFDAFSNNSSLAEIAKEAASQLALKWGLWTSDERLYTDAIRPAAWVIKNNPTLQTRLIFSGKLQATILVTLQHNPDAGKNESTLAKFCNVTRRSIRKALEHLELCQLITRKNRNIIPKIQFR